MASPQTSPKPAGVSVLDLSASTPLLPQDHGLCGKMTGFFLRNLALFLLLAVGLLALAVIFPAEARNLLGASVCKMHHDPQGKLWVECPQKIEQVFGPRRY